jgi:predicted anti-sigma-YlaC factor YlaD
VRPHFSDELDGELDETLPRSTRVFIRFHLTVCPACRRMARSLAATRDALSALRDADVVTSVDAADAGDAADAAHAVHDASHSGRRS